MLFKHSNLNSNLALTLGYLNPALNNSVLDTSPFVTAPQTTEADKTLQKWKTRVSLSITSGMFFCINFRIKRVRSFTAGQCYCKVIIIVILTFASVMINPCLVPRSHYSTGATCLRSRDPSMGLKLNKAQCCFVKNKNRSIGLKK